jgi:hypothetical protein
MRGADGEFLPTEARQCPSLGADVDIRDRTSADNSQSVSSAVRLDLAFVMKQAFPVKLRGKNCNPPISERLARGRPVARHRSSHRAPRSEGGIGR